MHGICGSVKPLLQRDLDQVARPGGGARPDERSHRAAISSYGLLAFAATPWSKLAVFHYLNEVFRGDSARLVGDDGTTLAYTVTYSFRVDENDRARNMMAPTSCDAITIISCDGTFYRANNPVSGGDYTGRRVIRASLTSRQGSRRAPL